MNHHIRSFDLQLCLMTLMMLLFFNSCQKVMQKKQDNGVQLEIETLQESIARLSDVPDVPLPVTIKKIVYSTQDPDQLQIFCDVASLSRIELCSYYEAEMERLGWSLQGFYEEENTEGLLVFVKPGGSLCVISLRDHQRMVITKLKEKNLL